MTLEQTSIVMPGLHYVPACAEGFQKEYTTCLLNRPVTYRRLQRSLFIPRCDAPSTIFLELDMNWPSNPSQPSGPTTFSPSCPGCALLRSAAVSRFPCLLSTHSMPIRVSQAVRLDSHTTRGQLRACCNYQVHNQAGLYSKTVFLAGQRHGTTSPGRWRGTDAR